MVTLDQHLAAFRARLNKEIARIDDSDTAAVGGLTKLGAAFEAFLRVSYREAAAQQRPPLPAVPMPTPRGSGEWLRALGALKPTPGLTSLLNEMIRESSQGKRLGRLARLRNIVAHEGQVPSPTETKTFLIQFRDWLTEAAAMLERVKN